MRDYLVGIGLLTLAAASWIFAVTDAQANPNNEALKRCLEQTGYNQKNFDTFDFSKAAACHSEYRIGEMKAQNAELRDFLKHNPRYRYPGQSNNKCWGKPRVQPFESSGIEFDGAGGYRAWVNYKDTIPAGCYETAPWDNRDAKD